MNKEAFIEKYAVDRFQTDSQKWDALEQRFGNGDLLSMWVADMEFKTSEKIIEVLSKRIEHGVFGYSFVARDYYQIFSKWMSVHHQFPIDKEWVRFSPGVVPAIYWMINAFTKPADACLILTPVYYPFHNAVKDTERKLVTVDLKNDKGYYTMDFNAIEKAIIDHQVRLFIMCSPHNPVGRVWSETELEKIMEICKRHQVLIVSDEIHQDIIPGDKKFIPAAIVDSGKYRNQLITLSAASKTFNLASLVHGHIIISDEKLRQRYDEYAKKVNHAEENLIGMIATKAGYQDGEEWLAGLLEVIRDNYNYVKKSFEEQAKEIVVSPLEGTYLLFLDLRSYIEPENTKEFIQDKCRLAVDYGEWFGDNFKGFIRLNLATHPKYVEEAVTRIILEISKLSDKKKAI